MPTYVHLLEISSSYGIAMDNGDDGKLNGVLETLQLRGAKILDIKMDIVFIA